MGYGVHVFEYISLGFWPCLALPCLCSTAVKKSIRLREEALANEQVKAPSKQTTSAEKLRKILKEERR